MGVNANNHHGRFMASGPARRRGSRLGLWLLAALLAAAALSGRIGVVGRAGAAEAEAAEAPLSVGRLYEQIRRMIVRKEWARALETVDRALAADPAFLPLWRQKAEIHAALNQPLAADDAFKVALLDPINPDEDARAALDNLARAAAIDPAERRRRLAERAAQCGFARWLAWLAAEAPRKDFDANLPDYLAAWDTAGFGRETVRTLFQHHLDGRLDPDEAYAPDRLAELPPATAGLLCYYGAAARLAAGQDAPVLSLLDRAADYAYSPAALAELRGEVHWTHGRPAEAAAAWETHWREAGQPGVQVFRIARAWSDAGRFDKAAEILGEGLRVFPRSSVLQGGRLLALYRAGDETAGRAFDRQLVDAKADAGRAYGRALIARHLNLPDEEAKQLAALALAVAYSSGQRLSATDVEAHLLADYQVGPLLPDRKARQRNLEAWAHWDNKDYPAAFAAWDEALSLGFADSGRLVANVASRYLELLRPDQAEAVLRRHDPGLALGDFGLQLADENHWSLARPALERLPPDGPDAAWHALYRAMAGLDAPEGDPVAAVRALESRPPPERPLAYQTLSPDGRVTRREHPPAYGYELLGRLGDEVVRRGLRDLFPDLLENPVWKRVATPQRARQLATIGLTLTREPAPAAARPYLDAALALDPREPRALLGLGMLAFAEGRTEEATRRVDEAIAAAPPAGTLRLYLLSARARAAGDKPGEVEALGVYLARRPDDFQARMRAFDLLVELGRADEARESLAYLETLYAEGRTWIGSDLAVAYGRLGDTARAERFWSSLAAERPDLSWRLTGLGDLLNREGRPEDTLARLSAAGRESGDPQVCALLAEAAQALGREAEALSWAERGLAAAPDNPRLLPLAAYLAETAGQPDKVVRYGERALALAPGNVSLRETHIRALMSLKRWNEADAANQTLLAGNPRHRGALERDIEIARERKSATPAELVAKEQNLLRWYGNDPAVRLRAARAATETNDYDAAFRDLEALAARGPNAAVLALAVPDASEEAAFDRAEAVLAALAGDCAFAGLSAYTDVSYPGAVGGLPRAVPAAVIVNASSRAAMTRMDAWLAERNGRAAATVDGVLLGTLPDVPRPADAPTPAELRAFADTGRWDFLLTDAPNRTVPVDAAGTTGNFWTARQWLGDRAETPEAFRARLTAERDRLARAAAEAGIPVAGWSHPRGDYGQRAAAIDPATRMAYGEIVAAAFPLAFAVEGSGYWLPGDDTWRIPVYSLRRAPPPATTAAAAAGGTPESPGSAETGTGGNTDAAEPVTPAEIRDDLLARHPTRRATMELARVASWDGQIPRAAKLFAEAERSGMDSAFMAYARGRNALYGGDPVAAMDYARIARGHYPENPDHKALFEDAARQLRPLVWLAPRYATDSNDEDFYELIGGGSWMAGERWQLSVDGGARRWKDEDGDIDAQTIGFGARRFVAEGRWLDLEARLVRPDGDRSVYPEGALRWHDGYAFDWADLNGTYDLALTYEAIDTRQAMDDETRQATLEWNGNLRAWNRLWLDYGLYAVRRTDHNDTIGGMLRPMWQFWSKPNLRVGYWLSAGTSDENPDAYYAPVDYQGHALVFAVDHEFNKKLSLKGLVSYGVNRSEGKSWSNSLRANVGVNWRITKDWELFLGYQRLDLPDYTLTTWRGNLAYRF